MVVIDHPDAIVQCANKVFLKELLDKHKVATPKTKLLLSQSDIDYKAISDSLGYPVVLKIPDGSFSIGVEKAENLEQLQTTAESLFKQSTILLAQEFIKTDYDWRIGVLNNRPIYACQLLWHATTGKFIITKSHLLALKAVRLQRWGASGT